MGNAVCSFSVKIAGVPIAIRCRHTQNRAFFAGWETDEEPFFSVEPQESDFNSIRASLEKLDRRDGREVRAYSPGLIENGAIHALIAERISEHNVLLMHGSAVAVDNKAYIFTAPSGTGKSTHTRLWREVFGDRAFMVNDDKPMIRIENGAATVYGTPWNGKHRLGGSTEAPLKAVIRLSRGETNSIEPIGAAEAFSVLLSQLFVPSGAKELSRTLSLARQLLETVRFYGLKCNMEREAALVAYNGMNTENEQTT